MTLDMVLVQKQLARKWGNEVITHAQQRFVLHFFVADALTPGVGLGMLGLKSFLRNGLDLR
jgi:hypothetical protein